MLLPQRTLCRVQRGQCVFSTKDNVCFPQSTMCAFHKTKCVLSAQTMSVLQRQQFVVTKNPAGRQLSISGGSIHTDLPLTSSDRFLFVVRAIFFSVEQLSLSAEQCAHRSAMQTLFDKICSVEKELSRRKNFCSVEKKTVQTKNKICSDRKKINDKNMFGRQEKKIFSFLFFWFVLFLI